MKPASLQYYLSLDYPVEIRRIPDDLGGGYNACIRELGKYAFSGDGETIAEAIADLEEVKEILFEEYLEKGILIPEPVSEEEKSYSGRFVLRLPVSLHRELAEKAEQNDTTLNQYCIHLLSQQAAVSGIQDKLEQLCQNVSSLVWSVQELQYSYERTPAWERALTGEKRYEVQVA